MRVYERFLDYVKINSASAENAQQTPSTDRQFDIAHRIAEDMCNIGLAKVFADEYAYVYGELAADDGFENSPAVGFIAHIDTAPDFPGENVKPTVIENYDGGSVLLGESGKTLEPDVFAHLRTLKGHTLITTDGTTVLGADDKAGIAEILTALEEVIKRKIPHGRIAVCFTPDEEIGHGAKLLDLESFGADFAYTVDGGEVCEINFETFNAASADWEIRGFNIHPGDAKGKMINAALVASRISSMLPENEIPAKTEGYEGFFHMTDIVGSVEKARLSYIIRDHDRAEFERRIELMRSIERQINEEYGDGTAVLCIRQQYRNMAELLAGRSDIIERAVCAMKRAGVEPVIAPVRGGTDGAQLTFRGLPCPNIGTGGYCFHGPYEHISVENMEKVTEIILNIIIGNG